MSAITVNGKKRFGMWYNEKFYEEMGSNGAWSFTNDYAAFETVRENTAFNREWYNFTVLYKGKVTKIKEQPAHMGNTMRGFVVALDQRRTCYESEWTHLASVTDAPPELRGSDLLDWIKENACVYTELWVEADDPDQLGDVGSDVYIAQVFAQSTAAHNYALSAQLRVYRP
jgi:hypothetical protein